MNKDSVYLVGGGISLSDFDFKELKDLDTIAVNYAAYDVPNPTYCITADSGVFKKLCIGKFNEIDTSWVLVTNPDHASMKWKDGVFQHIKSRYVYNLFAPHILIRNSGTEGIGFSFKDFKTGYNSGFCAFQLAVLLGYKKIHLLGFDLGGGSGSHYSKKYKKNQIDREVLERYYNNFVIAIDILKKQTDIEVISHSAISKLNQFIPFIPFKPKPKPKPHILITKIKSKKHIKLSILICSLSLRIKSLNRLLDILEKQDRDDIEILVETDDGEITTGAKRNLLLQKARGDYIVFVDDDDAVSEDYVEQIIKAIKTDPDCVGIEGIITSARKKWSRCFIHSIRYEKWFSKNSIYYRCPNHISPVKRELALKVGFPDKTEKEDLDYSMRLFPYLKTEVQILKPIYFYYAS